MINILCSNIAYKRNGEIYYYPIVEKIDPIIFSSFTFYRILNDFGIKFKFLSWPYYQKIKNNGKEIKNLIVYYEPIWTPEFGLLGIDLFENDFIIKHIPIELKELTYSQDLKIVLSTISEPFSWSGFNKKSNYGDKMVIVNTQKNVIKYNIPEKQIIILSGDLNAEKKWAKFVKEQNIQNPIIVKSFIAWGGYYKKYKSKSCEIWTSKPERINSINASFPVFKEPIDRKIAKTYISFNRHLREHRVLQIEFLFRYNLLNHGFVSCPNKIGTDTYLKIAKKINKQFKDKSDLIDNDFYNRSIILSKKILPLTLDVKKFDYNSPLFDPLSIIQSIDYYNKSFCSIISETAFDGFESIFLSEKVFKAMLMKHPFLVIGQMNTLSTLHDYGFITFSPFINESYDFVEHWIDRTHAVIKEIQRLSLLTQKEKFDILTSLKEILDYNYKWYQYGFQRRREEMLFNIIYEIEK